MFRRPLIAGAFLAGGGALVILGLILWATLPIRMSLPPFLFSGTLAGAYGIYLFWRTRPGARRR